MVFSTAELLNFRFSSGVRTTGKPVSAAQLSAGASANVEAAYDVLRINVLRFMSSILNDARKTSVLFFILKNKTGNKACFFIKLTTLKTIPIGKTDYTNFSKRDVTSRAIFTHNTSRPEAIHTSAGRAGSLMGICESRYFYFIRNLKRSYFLEAFLQIRLGDQQPMKIQYCIGHRFPAIPVEIVSRTPQLFILP